MENRSTPGGRLIIGRNRPARQGAGRIALAPFASIHYNSVSAWMPVEALSRRKRDDANHSRRMDLFRLSCSRGGLRTAIVHVDALFTGGRSPFGDSGNSKHASGKAARCHNDGTFETSGRTSRRRWAIGSGPTRSPTRGGGRPAENGINRPLRSGRSGPCRPLHTRSLTGMGDPTDFPTSRTGVE